MVVAENGKPVAPMRDGDAVICFNYRSDRMRQIVRALIDPAFDGFDVAKRPKVTVTTLTNYDKTSMCRSPSSRRRWRASWPRFCRRAGWTC